MQKHMEITPPSRVALSGKMKSSLSRSWTLTQVTMSSEAIEDLTGGVTTEILSSNILDKDKFWKEELMKVNKEFLFGCSTGFLSNWLAPDDDEPKERKGIAEMHAYSIMEAREIDGKRLVRLR
jgi:hypothetical protein